jgi:uncharacterized protein (TIGR03067 family)
MVRCLMVLAAGLALTASPRDDRERIQGDWVGVACQNEGEILPRRIAEQYYFHFEGDKVTSVLFGYGRTFTLDPSASPRAIDVLEEDSSGGPHRGIYALEGDTLRLCFDTAGGERPAKFAGKADPGSILLVLKRKKP